MTSGFRIAIKNYRDKSDSSGRVKLSRIKEKVPGRTVKSLHAQAAKTEAKWKEKGK